MFIINPGTETRTEHSLDNALVVAKHIASKFKEPNKLYPAKPKSLWQRITNKIRKRGKK